MRGEVQLLPPIFLRPKCPNQNFLSKFYVQQLSIGPVVRSTVVLLLVARSRPGGRELIRGFRAAASHPSS
jgi:hypothetical protein